MTDAALLAKLKIYDTPTICNALEVLDPARRLTGFTVKPLVCPFPALPPVVGYAKTATSRPTHPHELDAAKAREQRIAYYEYVASQPAPSVMVIQDLDGPDIGFGAFWGEVMSAVHQGLGCLGVVTDGCIRDIPQWAPGFQALAGSIAPSHAHVHLADFGKEVRVSGMLVRSGDLVHADRHGAVVKAKSKDGKLAEATLKVEGMLTQLSLKVGRWGDREQTETLIASVKKGAFRMNSDPTQAATKLVSEAKSPRKATPLKMEAAPTARGEVRKVESVDEPPN